MNLLDAKKSLNVNIFLRQFRVSHSELVDYLRTAVPGSVNSTDSSSTTTGSVEMGVERLRGLYKVLPEADEIEMLRTYSGDTRRLGSAEKFYIELMKLSELVLYVVVATNLIFAVRIVASVTLPSFTIFNFFFRFYFYRVCSDNWGYSRQQNLYKLRHDIFPYGNLDNVGQVTLIVMTYLMCADNSLQAHNAVEVQIIVLFFVMDNTG